MITANEIRLGNWFKDYENKYFEWELRHFELMTLSIDADEIIKEPIPLTEDILLKCGFKKHLDTLYIHWSKEGGMFEISTRLPDGSYGLWVNGTIGCFQYLHQLQNLYFALTQQELNIQL